MSRMEPSSTLVLPRPGQTFNPLPPYPGPSEDVFTKQFGKHLPSASYIQTAKGKAAYYEIPSSENSQSQSHRVLFVHGVQTPALGMLPLARTLHEAFPRAHFVLLDLWGHGLSDTPFLSHEQELFLGLIDDLLNHLNWQTADLVGYSFGGALTISYVATRPHKVASYAIVAPAGLIQSKVFSHEERVHLHGGGDEEAAIKWVIRQLEGGEMVVPEDSWEKIQRGEIVAQAVKEWQMRNHPGHTASVVAIFRDGGVMDNDAIFARAASLGKPQLAILGELDGVVSEQQMKAVGIHEVHVIPAVGHAVPREKPREVAKLITGFWLESHETA